MKRGAEGGMVVTLARAGGTRAGGLPEPRFPQFPQTPVEECVRTVNEEELEQRGAWSSADVPGVFVDPVFAEKCADFLAEIKKTIRRREEVGLVRPERQEQEIVED